MYKNLNQLTKTNVNLEYNNSLDASYIQQELNTPILFTKDDLELDYLTNQKMFVVENRLLRNCVIKCPNGQIWTGLDYKIHQKQDSEDIDKTIFNFTYIQNEQWQQGNYYIYPGSTDKGVRLYNANSKKGIKLLHIDGQDYKLKKIIAGNGIQFKYNDDQILIQQGQFNYSSQLQCLDINGYIDVYKGNFQIYYTYLDSQICDLIDSFYIKESSQSSESDSSYCSSSSYNECDQVKYVTILLYKPNQTLLTYKNQLILNKYDIGWFSCTIKKFFGSLFISQPARIITDFIID